MVWYSRTTWCAANFRGERLDEAARRAAGQHVDFCRETTEGKNHAMKTQKP